MTVGFVLITAAPSMEHEVNKKLHGIPEIMEAFPLFGEYDFIAKLETKNYSGISRVVTGSIRSIDGVIDTETLTGLAI